MSRRPRGTEKAAEFWENRQDTERAELERRNARVEREAAELERERARLRARAGAWLFSSDLASVALALLHLRVVGGRSRPPPSCRCRRARTAARGRARSPGSRAA